MKDVPIPPCKNTNRRTAKCRRMCCRREDYRVREDHAPGKQMNLQGCTCGPRKWKSGRTSADIYCRCSL